MVVADKNKNTFWLWSDKVDFQKRGDVLFWSPKYLGIMNFIERIENKPLLEFSDDFVNGSTPDNLSGKFSDDSGVIFFRNGNVKEIFIDYEDAKYVTQTNNKKIQRSQLKKFDVLVSIAGTIGNASIYLDDQVANINQNICRVRPKGINPFYLTVFLNTKYGREQLLRNASVQTIMYVNNDVIRQTIIPIVKDDEQRMVEKIVVDSKPFLLGAQNDYEKATFIVSKYLGDFCKTKNNNTTFIKWSDEIDLINRMDPDFYSDEELGSDFVSLGDYVNIAIGKTPAFDDYVENGKRILKFRAVTGNGLDWTNEERGFVKPSVASKNGDSCIKQDDILFGCAAHQAHYIGSKIDIVDFIPSEFSEGVLTVAEVMRIRSKGEVNPYVLLLFLRSEMGYQLIQKQVKGQTSHLYPKDVAQIKIPKQLLALSNSKEGKEIEEKLKSSIKKNRLSVEKLEEAKKFVENLIENK